MKVVILAGGFGTRLSEETVTKPKPMVEIGGKPILWHLMKFYSSFGFNDFIILLGYKGYYIKEYFSNYFMHNSDLEIDLERNQKNFLKSFSEKWKIKLIDTGDGTDTGGRIKKIQEYIDPNDSFFLTYGDGLSNVDIKKKLKFHNEHKKIATICGVMPAGRYGILETKNNIVKGFIEKPKGDNAWVNGGFFIMNYNIFNYLTEDSSLEDEVLIKLMKDGELMCFHHEGFWHAMDTLRDKNKLDHLWKDGNSPWKIW